MYLKQTIISISLLLLASLNILAVPQNKAKSAQAGQNKPAQPAASKSKYKPRHYKEIETMQEYNRICSSNKPYIVVYHAPWCGACTVMEPLYDEVAGKHKNLANFCAINVDNREFNHLIKENEIPALPTTIYSKNKKELRRERGSMTKDDIYKSVKIFEDILYPERAEKREAAIAKRKALLEKKKLAVKKAAITNKKAQAAPAA